MAKGLTAQSVERVKPDLAKRREMPDGLLPGLYFVIQPSGVRSWAVRYRHAGTPRKLTLGPYPALDLATARARARDALQAVAAGRDPAGEKTAARRVARDTKPDRDLMNTVVGTFLERHVRANNKERSAEETERIFRKHVLPAWGNRRIQDITRRDVVELLDAIVDKGTPIAANRTLAAVRKLFNWAIDRSVVEASPCVRIKAPSAERSRDRVLSDDELRWTWKAADALGSPVGAFVKMLALTAQRRDEVARATRSEMKDNGALWTIPGARTKNGVEHDVPLSEQVQRIVAALPRIGKSDFLFTTSGEAPISGYSQAKARLDAAMHEIARAEAAERGDDPEAVTLCPWRLHDLRRTVASGMARLGMPVNVIEAVLNHRSGQVSGIAAVYNRHSYLPEKRKAMEAWGRFVESLIAGRSASAASAACVW